MSAVTNVVNPADDFALPAGPLARRAPHELHYAIWECLEAVCDPEIPVVNLRDMGILRAVRTTSQGLEVVLTPTYSGCPALSQMCDDVANALACAGVAARVHTCLAPAWSTDWMTEQARERLRSYGIAPPGTCSTPDGAVKVLQFAPDVVACSPIKPVACPRCNSTDTTCISPFGSTACKALYRCLDCAEPFDYFKPY